MSPDQWFEIARNVPLLREITAPAFEVLRKEGRSFPLAPETVLFRKGEVSDSLYIVLEGKVRLEVPGAGGEPPQILAELGPGDCTGEPVLMGSAECSTTALASGPARVLRLHRQTLGRMRSLDGQLRRKISDLAARRRVSAHAASIPLLAGIEIGASLDRECNWLRLKAGQRLFSAGSAPDFLYAVVSGRLEAVRKNEAGDDETVEVYARGACIGDAGLLTGKPRSNDVRAVRDSELVRIAENDFEIALDKAPGSAARIAQNVAQRLQTHAPRPGLGRTAVSVIACVPAHPGERYTRFVSLLAECLARHGTTATLNRRVLDSQRGVELPDQAGSEGERRWLKDWIAEYETKNRYVLADCDTPHLLWREACLAQADLVLVVADAEKDQAPGEAERLLYDGEGAPRARRELVLLHPNGSRLPERTARWLAPRRIGAHHHLAADDRAHVEHLARMLTGNAVAIVLGGTGARGCLQLGVWKAMRELGIPVDMAAGTGIGAALAAQIGMGRDPETIVESCSGPLLKSLRGGNGLLADTTPAFTSLLSGRAHVKALKSIFGEAAIEDLWIPFFSIACSLTSSREVIHDSGRLWPALRASGSIPGILPPVLLDGEVLVCGGVRNGLPVDIMRRRCSGLIVAVDVGGIGQPRGAVSRQPLAALSGWSHLWRRLTLRPPQLPDLFETLSGCATLGNSRSAQDALAGADVYLRPPIDHFRNEDRRRLREGIDAVYRYALKELAARPEFAREAGAAS